MVGMVMVWWFMVVCLCELLWEIVVVGGCVVIMVVHVSHVIVLWVSVLCMCSMYVGILVVLVEMYCLLADVLFVLVVCWGM